MWALILVREADEERVVQLPVRLSITGRLPVIRRNEKRSHLRVSERSRTGPVSGRTKAPRRSSAGQILHLWRCSRGARVLTGEELRRERLDIASGLEWKRPAVAQVVVDAPGPCIVGGQKSARPP